MLTVAEHEISGNEISRRLGRLWWTLSGGDNNKHVYQADLIRQSTALFVYRQWDIRQISTIMINAFMVETIRYQTDLYDHYWEFYLVEIMVFIGIYRVVSLGYNDISTILVRLWEVFIFSWRQWYSRQNVVIISTFWWINIKLPHAS